MRGHRLVVISVVALPGILSAQAGRIPTRPGQRTPAQPASPPPEMPLVSKDLSYRRARWSTEAYTMISSIAVPNPGGGASTYSSIGAGTHAQYRLTERWSATMDFTASPGGGPATTQTAEVGTRFSPGVWSADYRGIRPYFDLRGTYMHMNDTFTSPLSVVATGSTQQVADGQRYSRGFGGVAGAGADFPLTNSFALTGEITGLRNRMTTYQLTSPANLPSGTGYWLTSFRFTFGVKYNPVSAMHLNQNPMK